jgi:hypothetical protein
MVDGITYLYSTNLLKKQSGDVIRALDTSEWDNGLVPKGMHKCARLCKKEGGGGICKAFTFCFYDKQCSLLSRLPDSLAAARPATDPAVVSTYNSKCISGFSQGESRLQLSIQAPPVDIAPHAAGRLFASLASHQTPNHKPHLPRPPAAASYEQLQQSCKATIHTNTLFSDTNTLFSSTKNASEWLCIVSLPAAGPQLAKRHTSYHHIHSQSPAPPLPPPPAGRPLKGAYEAAQQSAMDCCKLCDSMRDSGCTSWSYQPDGWLLDRSRRCT